MIKPLISVALLATTAVVAAADAPVLLAELPPPDDPELARRVAELDEQLMGSSDESIFNGLDVMTSPMKLEGMDMATVSLPVAQPYVSSRRHRWLCVERC